MATASSGGLRRWVGSLVLFGVVIGGTFLAAAAFFPGDTYLDRLSAAYEAVWKNTTRRQFTDIMRERPWLYLVPAIGVIFVSGWQLPRRFYGRAIYTYIVFGVGFVGGHVLW